MIYLDNAATTFPIDTHVVPLWMNSNTAYALTEQRALEKARQDVKDALGLKGGKVLFTSSATESAEWLIRQFDMSDGVVICSTVEHDSVVGNRNIPICVSNNKLRHSVIYLHQYVNQLTGDMWDIKDWYAKEKKQDAFNGTYFGSDITAAVGKVPLPTDIEEYCDALWFSAHKYGGICGVGFLWLSDRLFTILGGRTDPRNNYGLIHRTLNVESIVRSVEALKVACSHIPTTSVLYTNLYLSLRQILSPITESHRINSKSGIGLNYATNLIYLPGINADAIQQYLESREIYVGLAASACSGSHDFRVPIALGMTEEQARQSIRMSFCQDNTVDDVRQLAAAIADFKRIYLGG